MRAANHRDEHQEEERQRFAAGQRRQPDQHAEQTARPAEGASSRRYAASSESAT